MRISVRMLTTIGDCAFAMFLNVNASIGPLIGELFIDGTLIVCADEDGVISKRDARTSATAKDATALNRT